MHNTKVIKAQPQSF